MRINILNNIIILHLPGQEEGEERGAQDPDNPIHYGYGGRNTVRSADDGFNYYAGHRYGGMIGEWHVIFVYYWCLCTLESSGNVLLLHYTVYVSYKIVFGASVNIIVVFSILCPVSLLTLLLCNLQATRRATSPSSCWWTPTSWHRPYLATWTETDTWRCV